MKKLRIANGDDKQVNVRLRAFTAQKLQYQDYTVPSKSSDEFTMEFRLASRHDRQFTVNLSSLGLSGQYEQGTLMSVVLIYKIGGRRIETQVLGVVNRYDGSTLTFFTWPIGFANPIFGLGIRLSAKHIWVHGHHGITRVK